MGLPNLQLDGPVLVVHAPDRPAPARSRIDGGIRALEPVLLRRERESAHHRPFHLPDDLAAGQAAQRVRLIDQLRGAQRADVEVPSPLRLGVTPVPAEQISQQGRR